MQHTAGRRQPCSQTCTRPSWRCQLSGTCITITYQKDPLGSVVSQKSQPEDPAATVKVFLALAHLT